MMELDRPSEILLDGLYIALDDGEEQRFLVAELMGDRSPGYAGPLGDAASLDGSSTLIVPASPSLKLVTANGLTFTAWIKPVANASGTLFQQSEGGKGLALALKGGKLAANG